MRFCRKQFYRLFPMEIRIFHFNAVNDETQWKTVCFALGEIDNCQTNTFDLKFKPQKAQNNFAQRLNPLGRTKCNIITIYTSKNEKKKTKEKTEKNDYNKFNSNYSRTIIYF